MLKQDSKLQEINNNVYSMYNTYTLIIHKFHTIKVSSIHFIYNKRITQNKI